MARQQRTFTIYDVLDRKGVFDSNPANATAIDKEGQPLYQGPVQYPMMFYHPDGLEVVSVPGVWEKTDHGSVLTGEKKELVFELAENEKDEKRLRAEGWHDHPAKSMAAAQALDPSAFGGRKIPTINSAQNVSKLEDEIARLQAKLATMEPEPKAAAASKLPGPLEGKKLSL